MARTCTTDERNTIKAAGVNHLLRVHVADADGVMQDCSALGTLGLDLLDGAQWGETLDTPVSTGKLTIRRDTSGDSASPLMGTSSINRNSLGAYAPLFEKGRAILLETATVAPGVTPTSGNWKPMFAGRIDTVHWHDNPMTIDVSDLGAWVMDCQIQEKRQYIVQADPGAGPLLGRIIQTMLTEWIPLGTPVTLYEPVTCPFQPNPPVGGQEITGPGSLLSAARGYAQEIGWELRYRYDASDVFRLTLYKPARTNTTPDWTIGPTEYRNVTNLQTSIVDIRNYIVGKFNLNAESPGSVTSQDFASIAKYGGPNAIPRFMQINSALITDNATMQAYTDAVLSDLSEAMADQEIDLPYFGPLQIGDLCLFEANGDHYDTDQLLAVVGYQHSFQNGEGTTKIQARGKVAGAYRAWLRREVLADASAADDPRRDILRVSSVESADGSTRDYTLTIGALVDTVHVHYRTVPIDATGDIFDFSGAEDVSEAPGLIILSRTGTSNTLTFSLPHPMREQLVAIRMVPRSAAPDFFDGASWPMILDAAPPAINAKLTTSRVGAVGAVSVGVAFGVSDGPVRVQVYAATITTEALLLDTTLTSPAVLVPADYPALGGLALPTGKDSLSIRAVLTDVSGQTWDFGPALVNRDPLPQGTVTVGNYRAAPVFVIAYDPDTDSVIYTAHSGKTKTWNRAALDAAGSVVTYTLGTTPLDDSSIEGALVVDEDRSGAHVDFTGGGTTVPNVWSGTLHGQPKNPPTIKVDVEAVGDGDTVNVFGTPDTQVDESLYVHYRVGITDTALEYRMCNGASDPTPLAVVAGTRIGPSNFFFRVDGVGSPVALLASIALTHDQVLKHQMQSIGVQSSMPSAWTDVQLSLLPVPLIESVSAKYDPATRTLSAIVAGGARIGSVGIEFADNPSYSAPITGSGNVSDGGQLIVSTVLSAAQLGKPWHILATPFALASLGGLVGNPQEATVNVPAIIGDAQVSTAEASGVATVTIVIDDPGIYINNAWTDGTATGGLHAVLLALGVTHEVSMTSHTLVGTLNTWTLAIALDPLHPIGAKVYIHFIDGSVALLLDTSVDSNKISDVTNATVANNGVTATVTIDWDTDTLIGSNCARYSMDGGSTWTSTVTVSSVLQSQITIARAATKQTAIVQAKNAIDSAWGDQTTVEIDAYLSEGPTFDVHVIEGTTTTAVYWSCAAGVATLSIDGGAPATPASSPITVTRPAKLANKVNYKFSFVFGGQTITDSVDVLPIDSDTVTPNLAVPPGTLAATTESYTPTVGNPQAGGASPTLTVTCIGCTMLIGATTYPDGTTQTIASGTTVTANKPASTSTTTAKLVFVATLSGASEAIVIQIQPQLALGPSLTAHYETLTSTTGRIVWSCANGVVTVKIDGGSAATPSTSPIAITLDGSTHSYLFEAVVDGQTIAAPVTVPNNVTSGGSGLFSNLQNQVYDIPTNKLLFSWTYPDPTAEFDVYVSDDSGGVYNIQLTRTSAGATQIQYTPAIKVLATCPGAGNWNVGFKVQAVLPTTMGLISLPTVTNYCHS